MLLDKLKQSVCKAMFLGEDYPYLKKERKYKIMKTYEIQTNCEFISFESMLVKNTRHQFNPMPLLELKMMPPPTLISWQHV